MQHISPSLGAALDNFRASLEAFRINASMANAEGCSEGCPVVSCLMELLIKDVGALVDAAAMSFRSVVSGSRDGFLEPTNITVALKKLRHTWMQTSMDGDTAAAIESGRHGDDYIRGKIVTLINMAVRLYHELEPQVKWLDFISTSCSDVRFSDPEYFRQAMLTI